MKPPEPLLLRVRGLAKTYPQPATIAERLTGRAPPPAQVIQDINFDLRAGEVLGLVGESGSGKSTTAMALMRLQSASAGSIQFMGKDITECSSGELKNFRRQAQIIFQDPYQSLNPHLTVLQTVSEPLIVHRLAHGAEIRHRASDALAQVGLPDSDAILDRLPAGLSGGQRQRISIARAMILAPRLLVADEPVSMLDVSIRAGVLKLIRQLARDTNLGVLYISHDIATVRYLCDRIAVMYRGRIVEEGLSASVLSDPRHPYTKALISAVPRLKRPARQRSALMSHQETQVIEGGCPFRARCACSVPQCAVEAPSLTLTPDHRLVSCHLAPR